MIGYLILAFLVGGLFGMIGMALVASGPKSNLLYENRVLSERLAFLEKEKEGKRYKPVKDPRTKTHTLVN